MIAGVKPDAARRRHARRDDVCAPHGHVRLCHRHDAAACVHASRSQGAPAAQSAASSAGQAAAARTNRGLPQEPAKRTDQRVTGKVLDRDGKAVNHARGQLRRPEEGHKSSPTRAASLPSPGPAGEYAVTVKAGSRRQDFTVKIDDNQLTAVHADHRAGRTAVTFPPFRSALMPRYVFSVLLLMAGSLPLSAGQAQVRGQVVNRDGVGQQCQIDFYAGTALAYRSTSNAKGSSRSPTRSKATIASS